MARLAREMGVQISYLTRSRGGVSLDDHNATPMSAARP